VVLIETLQHLLSRVEILRGQEQEHVSSAIHDFCSEVK
jgi:hypothetical protein